jgi:hypothetical protein
MHTNVVKAHVIYQNNNEVGLLPCWQRWHARWAYRPPLQICAQQQQQQQQQQEVKHVRRAPHVITNQEISKTRQCMMQLLEPSALRYMGSCDSAAASTMVCRMLGRGKHC